MRQTISFVLLLIMAASCRQPHATSPGDNTPGESHHQRASQMIDRNEPFDSIIAVQKLAVEDMRAGRAPEPAYEILSQLGYLQSRTGAYFDALGTLQEASDRVPDLMRMRCTTFLHMGLIDSAYRYNKIALDKSAEIADEGFRRNAEKQATRKAWNSFSDFSPKPTPNPEIRASSTSMRRRRLFTIPCRISFATICFLERLSGITPPSFNRISR